jgi:hypothetical protein
MIAEETIDLYEAIKQMRKLSSKGKSFSFVHATWNRDKNTCEGIRHVKSARLRPAAKGDDVVNADYKVFYYDEEIREPRNCWQMLIIFFDDKQVILN